MGGKHEKNASFGLEKCARECVRFGRESVCVCVGRMHAFWEGVCVEGEMFVALARMIFVGALNHLQRNMNLGFPHVSVLLLWCDVLGCVDWSRMFAVLPW